MSRCCLQFLSLLVVLLWQNTPALSQDDGIAALSQRVRPSVVEVIGTVDATGDTSYGTGFVLSEPGLVVTNAHVVRGVSEAMVRSYAGALIASVEILHVDERVDLAILRVVGLDAKPLALRSDRLPPVGERVVAVGHPRGYEFTVSDGIVSARRSIAKGEVEMIQTTTPISPGSSGGPLLDLDGRVVGVCSLTLAEGQNINFAVPAREVLPVVKQALAIERSLGGAESPSLPPEALVRLVRRHREQGDLARASKLVRQALARHPRQLGLLTEAAEVAWSEGNYGEVAALVARMHSIAPEYAPGQQIQAAYEAQTGHCELAVVSAQAALAGRLERGQAAEAHAVLAECYGRLGSSEQALEHMEQALENAEIAALPDYHVLHAFLLQAVGRPDAADLAAVAALQAAKWDPLVQAALRERGLPRLLEIVDSRGALKDGKYLVRGVLRNRGPVPLEEVVVTAEGFDAEDRVVATGSASTTPLRLVPGQTGAFSVLLAGAPEAVKRFSVRVVDYHE